QTPGDLASQYNALIENTPINGVDDLNEGDSSMKINGELCKPTRLENRLYQFREGTEKDRVVLDSITSLQTGA
ncbi:isocitrate lyase, partial [Pseudoalteromonas carrageenovora]